MRAKEGEAYRVSRDTSGKAALSCWESGLGPQDVIGQSPAATEMATRCHPQLMLEVRLCSKGKDGVKTQDTHRGVGSSRGTATGVRRCLKRLTHLPACEASPLLPLGHIQQVCSGHLSTPEI